MIGVIGSGAFGTALANVLSLGGRDVTLFGRNGDQVTQMQKERRNMTRLPDVSLSETLKFTSDVNALSDAEALLMVIPAQSFRAFLQETNMDRFSSPIVLCAKGIEKDTGALQSDVLMRSKYAVVTGPGFAGEIASGLPTALTLACTDMNVGRHLQQLLSTPTLRLYLTQDVKGAQLGGALKNVMAIACGIVTGAQLGESARAALLTRGFAEMSRLAEKMGAQQDTLAGLSGFGDLVLTSTSEQSRNFTYGQSIGRGEGLETGKTVEGIATAQATCSLAKRYGVDMPIATAVADVLSQKVTIEDALRALMTRPLKGE